MATVKSLTSDHYLVNAIRAFLGKAPLYVQDGEVPKKHRRENHQYVKLERYSQCANSSCLRCGGSGYYDGEELGMACPCTGIAQREKRGESKVPRNIRRRVSAKAG